LYLPDNQPGQTWTSTFSNATLQNTGTIHFIGAPDVPSYWGNSCFSNSWAWTNI
jgi:hypothetical protein